MRSQAGVLSLVAVHERLAADPHLDKGLWGVCEAAAARPLWSYRVGDFRVIQAFDDAEVWILVAGWSPGDPDLRAQRHQLEVGLGEVVADAQQRAGGELRDGVG